MFKDSFLERSEILFGREDLIKLSKSTVALYGLGGVGAASAMDLVRSGIGRLLVFDFDIVERSNLNRLIFGFEQNIGRKKTDVFIEQARAVNPHMYIEIHDSLITGQEAARALVPADFYIDCIDTLNSKANLLEHLIRQDLPFITSMGTAGRLNPLALSIDSLWNTSACPLARSVRQRLRRFGILESARVPCLFSRELACPPGDLEATKGGRARRALGTAPFVPQVAGHILASYAVHRLLGRAMAHCPAGL